MEVSFLDIDMSFISRKILFDCLLAIKKSFIKDSNLREEDLLISLDNCVGWHMGMAN